MSLASRLVTRRLRVLASIVGALGLLSVLATAASAQSVQPYNFAYSFDGALSTAGPLGATTTDVAVNDVTGRVYALHRVNGSYYLEQFEPNGQFWSRPDWVNMGFGGGGIRYPDDLHSAETGENLPIAKVPAGVKFRPGDESPYAGRASFYQLRYGPYLIGMNASAEKTYDLVPPEGLAPASAPDLVAGKTLPVNTKVPPHATVVLYLGAGN